MVKKGMKVSIPETDVEPQVLNENGKRPAEDQKKDGKKRLKVKNILRQPTVNELNRLQETESLFNSNLFRLQVEEILQEVKVKEKTEKKFQLWFSTFKTHLDEIPEDDTEYDLSDQSLPKNLKVKLPISKKLSKTKCMFKFQKFSKAEVVGSYALGCAINAKLRVDVQITVPAKTYTKNDSINYRYHKKCAAYLAYIASHLTKLGSIEELKYTWLDGLETKPVLDIKPEGKLANHFTVRLSLSCETEAYKFQRFSPARNNLRETWLFGGESQENSAEIGPPTPFYNSTVLSDLTALSNQELLKETLSNAENLKQAVVLLKIWLRQRALQISGHVISLYVAHLVQTKRINNIMSSYQIVRNVWIALKTSDWDTKGVTLHKADNSLALADFLEQFPVVFLDVTGYYNLCWNVTKGTYNALRRESSLAVEMLDKTNINSFIPLFMVPFKPLMQFDHILRFRNITKLTESITSRAPKATRLNYGIDQLALVMDTLHSLFAKGLGDRVELILQMVDSEFSWSVKKSPEKAKEKDGFKDNLSFGFIWNPENAFNIVLKGPPANLPDAEEFRAFWGDKSELRRFQDGAITEACVWEGDSASERRAVTSQILDYLLKLKYDIPSSELFHIFDQLDTVTVRKRFNVQCEESSLEVIRAFEELRQDLRSLTQLPLDISAIYGTSPVFSYSAAIPPIALGAVHKPWRRGNQCLIKDSENEDGDTRLPEYTPVSKAIIELGHSGKWPGSLDAFRALKAAFHLQLASSLAKQHALPTQAHHEHLDVVKHGLVFRLEIAHPKEITLLRREIANGTVKYRETEESIELQCRTVLLPRLRGALHGLHQKCPGFGPVASVFQRWLSSHLLSPPLFPPTACELLVASVFVHSEPLRPLSSPVAGLAAVLNKLANTDWASEMVVLDFNDDMTSEDRAELDRKFSEERASFPPMCIVTSLDGAGAGVWARDVTAHTLRRARALARAAAQYLDTALLEDMKDNILRDSFPPMCLVTSLDGAGAGVWARDVTAHTLRRARALARAAAQYLDTALLEDMKDNILPMFVPSLSGYDVLIHLNPSLVPHIEERVDRAVQARAAPPPAGDVIPVVEFDPVQRYLDELRSAFGEWAWFFHDSCGGDVIAVLWKQGVLQDKDFHISNASALKPVTGKGETKYRVNTAAIIADFKILGKGLVQDVADCT